MRTKRIVETLVLNNSDLIDQNEYLVIHKNGTWDILTYMKDLNIFSDGEMFHKVENIERFYRLPNL